MLRKNVSIKVLLICFLLIPVLGQDRQAKTDFDVVVLGGTPGGIMTAIAAAKAGHTALILNRGEHIGGLPANGLGATDIITRGATRGLFAEFVGRVNRHYIDTYGIKSPQVKATDGGYYFEPHVAEKVFNDMLAEQNERITVLTRRQFDALPERIKLSGSALKEITVVNLENGRLEIISGKVFADATYEGDLAAAAGAPFRLGREGKAEFNEPMAGRLYKYWGGSVQDGSTGLADNAVQAYNFRLCLTQNPDYMTPFTRPSDYDSTEYLSLAEDIRLGRTTAQGDPPDYYKSLHQISSMVDLPNEKFDGNNHHQLFLSTDLPEENWPWPTSSWDWRDKYAKRLRSYTLGLFWFVQHDPSLPKTFRRETQSWGLAKSEYADNGHFPREIYVREGRRIMGEYLFTAHDALSMRGRPEHVASITASHYDLDSHAVRKREPGRVHLDGFFSYPSTPYTVPYGVIVPKRVDGLLAPVPVSGTHIGFSTLRMEPCWMAMGQAAGTAAALAVELGVQPRRVPVHLLQERLLDAGAVLIYFEDSQPGDDHFRALEFFAVRGFLRDERQARLDRSVDEETASRWIAWAGVNAGADYIAGKTTRGQLLDILYVKVKKLPPEQIERILAEW
ncbi:FAD-dependent oxidoreductase [candidate division KSB1 bacterium]